MHLRAVDRDDAHAHEPRLRAEREHLAEQVGQGVLVTLAKARDRGVIRSLVGGDHAVGDILNTLALDHPRGALSLAVGVEQQRDHHRRLVRRAAVAVAAIGGVERQQIHLLRRRQHEPRQVILRQPVPQVRR